MSTRLNDIFDPPPPANEHVNAALKKSNRLLMVINQLGFGKSIVIFHGWECETLIRPAALNNLTRLWSYPTPRNALFVGSSVGPSRFLPHLKRERT